MKRIISAVAIAGLFTMASCHNSELKEKEAALQAQQQSMDSMRDELAKKQVIDSMNEVAKYQFEVPPTVTTVVPVTSSAPRATSTRRRSQRSYSGSSNQSNSSNQSSSSNNNSNTVAQAPVATKKKGWSAKAKGALIGAGTGAAAGAIINKRNRAAGAVIGGVLGAGAGTGVGAIIDKKNDR